MMTFQDMMQEVQDGLTNIQTYVRMGETGQMPQKEAAFAATLLVGATRAILVMVEELAKKPAWRPPTREEAAAIAAAEEIKTISGSLDEIRDALAGVLVS